MATMVDLEDASCTLFSLTDDTREMVDEVTGTNLGNMVNEDEVLVLFSV